MAAMTKKELKSVLKPLIKECIKEVVFEDGILSSLISEVAKGLGNSNIIAASSPQLHINEQKRDFSLPQKSERLQDDRKMLLDAIGKNSYNGVNVFENTEPLPRGGNNKSDLSAPSSPLSSYSPSDEGVSIDGLMSIAGRNWKKLLT